MQLKALTRSGTGMAGDHCIVSNEMCGLKGGRELKTTRVADQASADWPWLRDCMEDTPTEVNPCHNALTFPSLRGTMVLKQSGRGLRLPHPFSGARNDKREPNEIATPPQVGAGNDEGAWWWPKEAATKSWRRDLDSQVSSLVSGLDEQDDYFYPRGTLHREGTGRSRSVRTPQMSLGCGENRYRI
jgi:hypothetical protein